MKNSDAKGAMTESIHTIQWGSPMLAAHNLMNEKKIRHLPVVDKSGSIIGILSDRDISRAMNPRKPGFKKECLVDEYMSWPVATVDQEESLCEVAKKMIEDKISAYVVTNKKNDVVGIVTTEDILKYFVTRMMDAGLPKVNIEIPQIGHILPAC